MMNILTTVLVLGVALAQAQTATAQSQSSVPSKPDTAIATQFAWSADDGLTQRFVVALNGALALSQEFDTSRRTARETLRLYLPKNVRWTEVRGRLSLEYVVIFTNQDSKYLGVSIGSCWAEAGEAAECAQTVLREAGDAWRRRFEPQHWP